MNAPIRGVQSIELPDGEKAYKRPWGVSQIERGLHYLGVFPWAVESTCTAPDCRRQATRAMAFVCHAEIMVIYVCEDCGAEGHLACT